MKVRVNTTPATLKSHFEGRFSELIKDLEGTIKIDYFKNEIQNIKEGTAIFHFSEKRDVDSFIRYFEWKKVNTKNYEEAKKDSKNTFAIRFKKT